MLDNIWKLSFFPRVKLLIFSLKRVQPRVTELNSTTEHEHLLNVFESRVALIKNTLNSGLTFNLREIKIERMKSYLNLAYLSKD